ncbi:hypothetical protein GCM10009863_53120 [Streptomyces axinellae]|uniref:CobE/GbiG C-terminal domain-containing protein n=1 Tax=Streptomyces axinellae TaxID=552788 RepID=A0ABN3QNB3_9ACTN
MGACQGVPPAEVRDLVRRLLADAGRAERDVTALATVAARAGEPALLALAARLSVPLLTYGPTELARVRVPHPSAFSHSALGTPSVAEAAALLAARGAGTDAAEGPPGAAAALLAPKTKSRPPHGAPARATAALAHAPALGASDVRAAGDQNHAEAS